MMYNLQGLKWISFVVILVMFTGCSLGAADDSAAIDPPQVTPASASVSEGTEAAVQSNPFRAMLYVEDADGYVAPLGITLPADSVSFAAKTLEYMVRGGPVDSLLPSGFRALLPEGTKVVSLDIDPSTRTATIDFNQAFTNYPQQDERKILEAVTWAMTHFPTVDHVQLWVQGKWLKEMPVAKTPLDEPLSRKFGINVERAAGVEYSRATPVTLYFMNETADSFAYYVPVTRLVDWTDNVAEAAMAELVKGPQDTGKLESVFLPGLEVNEVAVSADKVIVDLHNSQTTTDGKLPGEGLQAVVLTMADTTAVQAVQIMIDGQHQAIGTDEQNYGAQPVVRPNVMNLYKE